MAVVTVKGQVTLPKAIREALGIEPGSEVDFELEDGKVILRKKVSEEALSRWEGRLWGALPASSVDEMMELLRGERASEDEG